MKRFLILSLILLVTLSLSAQEGELQDDFYLEDMDSLFGDDAGVEEVENPDDDLGQEDLTQPLEWGGRLISSYESSWSWMNSSPIEDMRKAEDSAFTPDLQADLYFDSQPDEDFRVFGKLNLKYPAPAQQVEGTEVSADESISIKELFADFDYRDKVFFRAGKQTMKWGVGYFFRPSDVINLTPIDPFNFEEEREGPIALKTQIPMGNHNTYMAIIAEDVEAPEVLGFAPKAELLIGTNELTLGGYFQKNKTPKVMATLTGPIGDFDYFFEAMGQNGSDSEFLDPDIDADQIFFAGTAGFNYWKEAWDFRLLSQYYYDTEKYSYQDFMDRQGMHQGALYLSWASIADSDFDFTCLWMGMFEEMAGLVNPELTWNPMDYASLSLGLKYFYGDYILHSTPLGLPLTADQNANNINTNLYLTARLGVGSF